MSTCKHFVQNDIVEAWSMTRGRWETAQIVKDAPYLRAHRGGSYVHWLGPTPEGHAPNYDGWVDEYSIRPARKEAV